MAALIFTGGVRETIAALEQAGYWNHPAFDLYNLARICSSSFTSMTIYFRICPEHIPAEDMRYLLDTKSSEYPTLKSILLAPGLKHERFARDPLPLLWTPRFDIKYAQPISRYTVWATVWIRINVVAALFRYYSRDIRSNTHAQQYLNMHLPLIQQLDQLEDPCNANIHPQWLTLQVPQPVLRHQDRSYIQVETNRVENEERLVLSYLQRHYPHQTWCVEPIANAELNYGLILEIDEWYNPAGIDALDHAANYRTYWACLQIMFQCRNEHHLQPCDQLYWYFMCFRDFIEAAHYTDAELAAPFTPKVTHWQRVYPYDNRAFIAHDLPDAYPSLMYIPLWGPKQTPDSTLIRFIQKSLPFASQRRKIVSELRKHIMTEYSFFLVFSKLLWCMLSCAYPSEIFTIPSQYLFDMPRLIELNKMCSERDRVHAMMNSHKMGPVVTTAFRMWTVYMMHAQLPWVLDTLNRSVNWLEIAQCTNTQSLHLLEMIDITSEAPFKVLIATKEKREGDVCRYKDADLPLEMHKKMYGVLQQHIFSEQIEWELPESNLLLDNFVLDANLPTSDAVRLSLNLHNKVNRQLSSINPTPAVKDAIIALLIRVPQEQRYSAIVLGALRLPEYGGISDNTVISLLQLLRNYELNSRPREMNACIENIPVSEFGIVSWFFNVAWLMSSITLIPLPQDIVKDIDNAMIRRKYMLYPGQTLNPNAFDVTISLCCNQIHTQVGYKKCGHANMIYNIDTSRITCTKNSNNTINASGTTSQRRKNFMNIPCENNTPLTIPIRGYMLCFRPTLETRQYILHCPQCGDLHNYDGTTWTFGYKCRSCYNEGLQKDPLSASCYACGTQMRKTALSKYHVNVIDVSPQTPGDYLQHVYFCKKHYYAARSLAWKGVPIHDIIAQYNTRKK